MFVLVSGVRNSEHKQLSSHVTATSVLESLFNFLHSTFPLIFNCTHFISAPPAHFRPHPHVLDPIHALLALPLHFRPHTCCFRSHLPPAHPHVSDPTCVFKTPPDHFQPHLCITDPTCMF
ncbi:hypothetical protein PAXRUDRAFT_171808 [Paxillus rubicundulus Ve08.2h10]|uniref:Uncharacterized protein n=1 Tax=Paxillus rubicundulus Ve08.2h10 TaxID=930991 RepID=A0A0D0CKK0_9AGAM|nr:hypothetical protein PAXRUDRAFT_171808 [Paxillus rubicundulus Ve08.2h10]